jgi:hypothetical protein
MTIGIERLKFELGHVAGIGALGLLRSDGGAASGHTLLSVRSPRGRHIVEPNDSILWGRL